MKVNVLLLCLAVVPLVAAQAGDEPIGILGRFKNFLSDLVSGTVDTQRYREDLNAQLESSLERFFEAWNKTKELLEDISQDVSEQDLPTMEEVVSEVSEAFDNLQTTLNRNMNTLHGFVAQLDPFDIIPDADQGNPEADAEAEPASEPSSQGQQEERPWWALF